MPTRGMKACGEPFDSVDQLGPRPVALATLDRPIAGSALSATGPMAWADGDRALSTTVLVVEDDPSIQELVEAVLESAGYGVVVARDGLEGIDQLREHRPALILLDMMMPRMDGVSFAKELGRRGLRPAIPIVVMSAAEGAGRWTAEIGAEGYLRKPFDVPELLDTVARIAT